MTCIGILDYWGDFTLLPFSREKALDQLKQIFDNVFSSIEQKAMAALHIAKEIAITEEGEMQQEAGRYLKYIIKDSDVSKVIQMEAAHQLAKFRLDKKDVLIDDKKAVKYLLKIRNFAEVTESFLSSTGVTLARFYFENRTDQITEEEAFRLLNFAERKNAILSIFQ